MNVLDSARDKCGGRSEKFERPKSLAFAGFATKDLQEVRGRNKAPQDNAAGTFKVNQPGGFHVNNNDTTAVLSPISEQAEETETSSQPANALSGDGQPKTTDRATSGLDRATAGTEKAA